MISAAQPADEFERLHSVHSLNILDTPPDLRIDCINQFIANAFDAPMSMVVIMDAERAWLKSAHGIKLVEIPRNISVCAHAICDISTNNPTDRIYEISDLKADNRFTDAPYIATDPYIRSYISYVMQSETGNNIGTLCIVDTQPRKFADDEKITIMAAGIIIENILLGRHCFSGMGIDLINLLKDRF